MCNKFDGGDLLWSADGTIWRQMQLSGAAGAAGAVERWSGGAVRCALCSAASRASMVVCGVGLDAGQWPAAELSSTQRSPAF